MEILEKQKGIREKIIKLLADLNNKFIERDELSRLLILTVLSKQHIFLIGEPGVGKTDITSTISSMVNRATFWEKLLDYDTKKHELFGDSNIPFLELDKRETILGNHFIFLDEMFKAPSEPLNATLPLLNERVYHDKGRKHSVPIISVFGASNEMPEGKKIAPFDDRLIFRYDVIRIQKSENFKKFINKEYDTSRVLNVQFELDDIEFITNQAKSIVLSEDMVNSFNILKMRILKSGIKISDRKFGKAVEILRVSAFLNCRESVDFSDFFILNHIAWTTLEDRPRIKTITYQHCYSSSDEVDSIYNDAYKLLVVFKSKANEHLSSFFNYNYESNQFSSKLEYDFKTLKDVTLKSYLKQAEKVVSPFLEINKKRDFANFVSDKIDNNLFVLNVADTTYTKDVMSRNEEAIKSISYIIQKIVEWDQLNLDYYTFQQNCIISKEREV